MALCLPATFAHAGEPTKGGKVTKVSTGLYETAYVTADGALYLCGAVGYDDSVETGNRDTPVRVPFDGKVSDVAIAGHNCMFLDDAGNLYIYGRGMIFEEQDGNFVDTKVSFRKTPVKIDSGVSKIAMGGSSSPYAAYVKNGELYTFSMSGETSMYEPGKSLLCRDITWSKDINNGCFTDNSNVPTKADFDSSKYGKIADVYISPYNIAAVITENGDLYAWGNNQHGELGTGSLTGDESKYWVLTPQKVASNVKKVAAAEKCLGYLTDSGEIYFTGNLPHYLYKRDGKLGIKTDDYTYYSSPVKYDDGFSDFFLEEYHMGFVTAEGSLYTWGSCAWGKLGNGDDVNGNFVEIPQKVLDDVASVEGGLRHTVSLTSDGTLMGFGDNEYGQVVNNENGDNRTSTPQVMHQAHDHTAVNVDAVDANCVTPGSKAGTRCSECGEILSGCEEIPATGNHIEDEGTVTKAVTCSVAGEKIFSCKTCKKELRKETIPATGKHSWDEGVSIKDPTCTTTGTTRYTCTTAGCTASENRESAALGHDYGIVSKPYVAPTYSRDGMSEERKCSMCGKVTEKAVKIPRLSEKAQSVTVKTTVKKVSKSKLKKKAQVVSGSISVKNAKGKISYAKVSGSSKLSINKANGKVTVKKKTKKGTYSFKVKVNIGGSSNGEYKATSRTVTVKVKVA